MWTKEPGVSVTDFDSPIVVECEFCKTPFLLIEGKLCDCELGDEYELCENTKAIPSA